MKTKTCTKCKKELPPEAFGNSKSTKDGLNYRCKECCKQHYYDNREKTLKDVKMYREQNREKVSERKRQHYESNKNSINQYKKQWYEENKECVLHRARLHREVNKDTTRTKKKQYNKENPGNGNGRAQKYRAKKERLAATLTDAQWEQALSHFYHECAYCGKKSDEQMEEYGELLHREHFTPLSSGGGYTHNNIIPACKGCNASKSNKDFFVWYPEQKFYSKQKEDKILDYLNYAEHLARGAFSVGSFAQPKAGVNEK